MIFFFIHDQVTTILPKPDIYFLLGTGHKFGFSLLKEKRGQIVLDHSTVCFVPSVALKGFMAALPAFYRGRLCQHQQLIIQYI